MIRRIRIYVVLLQSQIFSQSLVGQTLGVSADLVIGIPSPALPGQRTEGFIYVEFTACILNKCFAALAIFDIYREIDYTMVGFWRVSSQI